MQQHINTFTNETIIYDEAKHHYYSPDGRKLLGASTYAKDYGDTFNKGTILPRLAKQWDMPAEQIDHIWSINAEISNSYGTAIHAALELWFRYHHVGETIKERKGMEHNYCLPKNVYIRDIVLDFVSTFGELDGVPEATLSNTKKGMAGRTDLIVLTGEKTCRVGDFKTNNDLNPDKLLKYQHQLSFYADMLTEAGWTVEGLDIFHHDGNGWTGIPLEVLPVVLPEMPTGQLSTVSPRPPAFKSV